MKNIHQRGLRGPGDPHAAAAASLAHTGPKALEHTQYRMHTGCSLLTFARALVCLQLPLVCTTHLLRRSSPGKKFASPACELAVFCFTAAGTCQADHERSVCPPHAALQTPTAFQAALCLAGPRVTVIVRDDRHHGSHSGDCPYLLPSWVDQQASIPESAERDWAGPVTPSAGENTSPAKRGDCWFKPSCEAAPLPQLQFQGVQGKGHHTPLQQGKGERRCWKLPLLHPDSAPDTAWHGSL